MNRQLSHILDAAIKGFLRPFGVRRRELVLAQLAPRLVPVAEVKTKRGAIKLESSGRQALNWARFFFSHEPATLDWIESFRPGDVFWDIGANVGIYSLYAALDPDVTVLAFEPAAANYAALNRNIHLNGRSDRIAAYCLAFADQREISALRLRTMGPGSDVNVYGEGPDSWGNIQPAAMLQGAVGFGVDAFIAEFDPPFPSQMKVDVDGAEDKIIAGAAQTLADPRLKSLLIEFPDLDSPRSATMRATIEGAGLVLERTVATERANEFDLIFRRA
jgi:FkbM family methyltransferase